MSVINKRNVTIAAVVVGIPALIIAWWLFSPLFLDAEVNEDFPISASAEIPDEMTREDVEAEMEDAAAGPDTETDDSMPESKTSGDVEVTAVASGEFQDADDFHKGSGTATVYTLGDGSQVLRLEDFEVTNGPDLHVYLVPHQNPTNPEDVEGYIDLGSLKGNIGDQNYEIPSEVDIAQFGSVVIYCEPFHVIFSVAGIG